jgi:hypothetical protein
VHPFSLADDLNFHGPLAFSKKYLLNLFNLLNLIICYSGPAPFVLNSPTGSGQWSMTGGQHDQKRSLKIWLVRRSSERGHPCPHAEGEEVLPTKNTKYTNGKGDRATLRFSLATPFTACS